MPCKSRKSILLVEDEDILRSSLTRLFQREDYLVVSATSVEEAVKASPLTFDVIVTDVRLESSNGMELVDLYSTELPIIVITAFASVKGAVESMQKGAVDYLVKPFSHEDLLEKVATAVERKQLMMDEILSLDEYFKSFVIKYREVMTDTQMAKCLGISRKTLWNKKQKFGL